MGLNSSCIPIISPSLIVDRPLKSKCVSVHQVIFFYFLYSFCRYSFLGGLVSPISSIWPTWIPTINMLMWSKYGLILSMNKDFISLVFSSMGTFLFGFLHYGYLIFVYLSIDWNPLLWWPLVGRVIGTLVDAFCVKFMVFTGLRGGLFIKLSIFKFSSLIYHVG